MWGIDRIRGYSSREKSERKFLFHLVLKRKPRQVINHVIRHKEQSEKVEFEKKRRRKKRANGGEHYAQKEAETR